MASNVSQAELEYYRAYGRSIIAWNVAEEELRALMVAICGHGLAVQALTARMDALAMQSALQTIGDAYDNWPNDVGAHLCHLVAGLGILRLYRNSYVHDINDVTSTPGAAVASFYKFEAKGEFKIASRVEPASRIEDFHDAVESLRAYVRDIATHFQMPASLRRKLNREALPLASLKKPIWPRALCTNRQRLLERQTQPRP